MAGSFPGNVGEADVPPGREKKLVIDLTTSKVVPEAAFGRQSDTAPARALPAARRLAVNDFETTADTLGPLADCYFCRSVHNGARPQQPIEHR